MLCSRCYMFQESQKKTTSAKYFVCVCNNSKCTSGWLLFKVCANVQSWILKQYWMRTLAVFVYKHSQNEALVVSLYMFIGYFSVNILKAANCCQNSINHAVFFGRHVYVEIYFSEDCGMFSRFENCFLCLINNLYSFD